MPAEPGLPVPSHDSGALRLVVITHFYPAHGGGIERVAGRLVDEFARRGAAICWFSSDTDDPPQTGDGRVRCVPVATSNLVERLTQLPYPLWSPFALRTLWRAIGGADVVHIHEHLYAGSIVALIIARLRGRAAVITQHMGALGLPSPALTRLYSACSRLLGHLLMPLAARRIFISANVRAFFGRSADPRSSLIFNGIDGARFRVGTALQRQRLRTALELTPDRRSVLFVGRFVRKKGLHAIRLLAERFPAVLWIIVGSGPEDPAGWAMPNVRVPGRLDHDRLPDYYRAADLLVLPSSGEGFPLVVQEALCCGTGVVSTNEVATACPPAAALLRAAPTPVGGDIDLEAWTTLLAATLNDTDYLEARDTRSAAAHALWSWDTCAGEYLQAFHALAAPVRRGRPPGTA